MAEKTIDGILHRRCPGVQMKECPELKELYPELYHSAHWIPATAEFWHCPETGAKHWHSFCRQCEPDRQRLRGKKTPEKLLAKLRRHNNRKNGTEGEHTEAEFHDVCRDQLGQCAYCGEQCDLTRDHICPPPLGTDGCENLVGACGPCNSSKADRVPQEWLDEKPSRWEWLIKIGLRR